MKKLKKLFSALTVFSILLTAAVPTHASDDFTNRMNELMPTDQNYMFSPLSIKMALAMTANGAEGETQKEMLDILGIEDLDSFNRYAKQLTETYAEEDEDSNSDIIFSRGGDREKTVFKIANSIWLNTDNAGGSSFSPDYKATVSDYYSASAGTVNNDNAVGTINSWVSENTNGRIKRLISDNDFISLIANSVYFKAQWSEAFSENATYEDTFTDRGGKKTRIDFMHDTGIYRYYEDNDIQLIELPYSDGRTAMYLALSNDKRLDLTQYLDKLGSEHVKLAMPKFKFEYSNELSGELNTIGMQKAFSPNTDFNRMFTDQDMFFINFINHNTFIEVDENGTEAAAATAIGITGSSGPGQMEPEYKYFTADRPFTFMIADKSTKDIFFMGEYAFADENTLTDTIETVIEGDADGSGSLDSTDSAMILQKALVSTYTLPIENTAGISWLALMDINGSGDIDADDSARILQKVLKNQY